jgi:chaperonin GroES
LLKPLGNRVIVEVAKEEEKSVGGIVLPSSAKEKSQTGTVIAVGAGRVTDNGVTIEMTVKAGDTVLFEKYAGTRNNTLDCFEAVALAFPNESAVLWT